MEVISRRSTLNPNAPLFVPLAYRSVEDFSDQWWALVHSSPWFRDYWLQERFQDPQNDPFSSDFCDPAFPDVDALFDEYDDVFFDDMDMEFRDLNKEEETEGVMGRELVAAGAFKWNKDRASRNVPRLAEKAPKIVNVKVSPRMIQQPSENPDVSHPDHRGCEIRSEGGEAVAVGDH